MSTASSASSSLGSDIVETTGTGETPSMPSATVICRGRLQMPAAHPRPRPLLPPLQSLSLHQWRFNLRGGGGQYDSSDDSMHSTPSYSPPPSPHYSPTLPSPSYSPPSSTSSTSDASASPHHEPSIPVFAAPLSEPSSSSLESNANPVDPSILLFMDGEITAEECARRVVASAASSQQAAVDSEARFISQVAEIAHQAALAAGLHCASVDVTAMCCELLVQLPHCRRWDAGTFAQIVIGAIIDNTDTGP